MFPFKIDKAKKNDTMQYKRIDVSSNEKPLKNYSIEIFYFKTILPVK